jgi:hypothetical protein
MNNRIALLSLLMASCQAADVIYPRTPDSPTLDTILVTGVVPAAVGAGQVKIGGGMVYAGGHINSVANMNAAGYGLISASIATGDYRALGRTAANAIMLRSYSSNEGGNGNLVLASADNNGIYEFFTILGGSGPFGIFLGNDPGTTVAGQVRIGGGVIRAMGSVIVGVDPGGAEPLRVGGAMRANGALIAGADLGVVPAAGQVSIGGGFVRAATCFRSDGIGDRVSFVSTGSNSNLQIGHFGNDSNARIFNSGGGVSVCLNLNNQGVGTFLVAGSPVGTPAASQVLIGGGDVHAAGNIRSNATIYAKEIKVQVNPYADYVFADDYRLRPLAEVETAIKRDRHLPGVPAAAEIEKHGLPVAAMMVTQMEKIEELTLYAIAADKRQQEADQTTAALRRENQELKDRLAAVERLLGIGLQVK